MTTTDRADDQRVASGIFRSTNVQTCPMCEYDMTGLTGGRCPECGLQWSDDALIVRGWARKRDRVSSLEYWTTIVVVGLVVIACVNAAAALASSAWVALALLFVPPVGAAILISWLMKPAKPNAFVLVEPESVTFGSPRRGRLSRLDYVEIRRATVRRAGWRLQRIQVDPRMFPRPLAGWMHVCTYFDGLRAESRRLEEAINARVRAVRGCSSSDFDSPETHVVN